MTGASSLTGSSLTDARAAWVSTRADDGRIDPVGRRDHERGHERGRRDAAREPASDRAAIPTGAVPLGAEHPLGRSDLASSASTARVDAREKPDRELRFAHRPHRVARGRELLQRGAPLGRTHRARRR